MADALLVADQYLESTALLGIPRRECVSEGVSGSEIDACRYQSGLLPSEWTPRKRRAATGHQLVSVTEVLEQLAARQRQRDHEVRLLDEMEWIARNRTQFAGQWVALSGSTQLAAGASAREVFEASKGEDSTPLIVYLEPEPLPFLGW